MLWRAHSCSLYDARARLLFEITTRMTSASPGRLCPRKRPGPCRPGRGVRVCDVFGSCAGRRKLLSVDAVILLVTREPRLGLASAGLVFSLWFTRPTTVLLSAHAAHGRAHGMRREGAKERTEKRAVARSPRRLGMPPWHGRPHPRGRGRWSEMRNAVSHYPDCCRVVP